MATAIAVVIVNLRQRGSPLLYEISDSYAAFRRTLFPQHGLIDTRSILDSHLGIFEHVELLDAHFPVALHPESISVFIAPVGVEHEHCIRPARLVNHILNAHGAFCGILIHDDPLSREQPHHLREPGVDLILRGHHAPDETVRYAGPILPITPKGDIREAIMRIRAADIGQLMRSDPPSKPYLSQ